jgi:hypothetical protein
MMDTHRKILIDLHLKAENFTVYKTTVPKMYFGVNLAHLYRVVKSVKKKEILELFIAEDNPTKLSIRVFPKENNRITTSQVTIQSVQELDIDIPHVSGKPIVISSSEYQKLIKEMNSIGNMIKIKSRNFNISFSCGTGGIIERSVEFGHVEPGEEVDGEEDVQTFMSDQLSRITKISGLSSSIKIYPGSPIMFKSTIDNMGEISIFVKNKDQIDADTHVGDEDEAENE